MSILNRVVSGAVVSARGSEGFLNCRRWFDSGGQGKPSLSVNERCLNIKSTYVTGRTPSAVRATHLLQEKARLQLRWEIPKQIQEFASMSTHDPEYKLVKDPDDGKVRTMGDKCKEGERGKPVCSTC